MKEEEKNDYVAYRLEKADETFEAAVLLFENEKWNSTVNRLYYACFYAVSALLVKNSIHAKSHNGVKTQFFQYFIKDGKIAIKYGQLYSDLFAWRQEGDYDDFVDFKENDITPLILPTKEFISVIREIIENPSI